MSPVYDRRFIGCFLGELQKRKSPSYPALDWWRALRAADLQAANLPSAELGEALSSIQAVSHTRRLSHEKSLMTSVALACDRWWRKYGVA